MSRRKITAGSTSITVPIFIQDTSSTTGAGLGSLVYNSSGLAAKYRREGQNSWTTITLATATVGTFTSGGFIADGGPVTGGYEVGIPDAVLAASAKWAEVVIYGATNMLPVLLEFELDVVNYQAALATQASVDAIDDFLDTEIAAILADTNELQTDWADGGRLDVILDARASQTSVDAINTKIGTPAGVSVSADIAAVKADTGNLVTRITATLFSGITSLAQWLGLMAGKQTGNTTARTELRATGNGSGTFSEVTDSLEAMSEAVSEIDTGSGTGARSVTITVNDGTTVLESATVRLTSGASSFLATTNASGVATFSLDDATYSVTITRSGYSFTPTTLIVNGTETQTYSMSQLATTASDPGYATGRGWAESAGVRVANVVVQVRQITAPGSGVIADDGYRSDTSDALGYVEFTGLIQGGEYEMLVGTVKKYFTVPPDDEPFELPSIVG